MLAENDDYFIKETHYAVKISAVLGNNVLELFIIRFISIQFYSFLFISMQLRRNELICFYLTSGDSHLIIASTKKK